MEIEELELKGEYTKEEVRVMIGEVLFQVSQDIDDNYYDIKDEINKETNSLIKAGLERRKKQALKDRSIVDDYAVLTSPYCLSECCDAEIVRVMPLGEPECEECGQLNPDMKQKEADLERLIKLVNNKINSGD